MSIYADPAFVAAEIDYRYHPAGARPVDQSWSPLPRRPRRHVERWLHAVGDWKNRPRATRSPAPRARRS